jgi:hypothetical protein
LPLGAQRTLYHVLFDRFEQEATAAKTTRIDPPPIEVFLAFERLDAGNTSFTIAKLRAIQTVLIEFHHTSTWWELERTQIEQLLQQVTSRLDQQRAPCSAD